MLESQKSRLMNITKQEPYIYNTIYLNEQKSANFTNRENEIRNEFDLVDFHQRGYLFRGEIEDYLQKKYQWVNKEILNELFNTIDWKRKDMQGDLYVEKEQFCRKYIKRERLLFYEYSRLQSEQQWFESLYNIYQRTSHLRPSFYVSVQILKLEIYQLKEDFVNVNIRYEDHNQKLEFNINQSSYDPTKPSFQLILPSQQNHFFLSYNFTHKKNQEISYGNTYIRLNLNQSQRILKQQEVSLDVKKHGITIGRCRVLVTLESNNEVIKQKLKYKSLKIKENLKERKDLGLSLAEIKRKQYEYLQFLWGIRHLPPAKIQQQNVNLIVFLRTFLIIALGCLGIVVHVLGRCEPLSLICAFMMLKWRTYVILKVDMFFMLWLIIASILLDGIWLVFSSHHVSQITFLNLHSSLTVTYFLLGAKALFFIYLLAFQNPFKTEQQNRNQGQNQALN